MDFKKNERGEVMLEGTIVMVVTMLMLVWILGIGFLYYQRYVTTAVAHDTASKIASTFDDPTSDIMMGYVSSADLNEKDLYRGFLESSLIEANEYKAKGYAEYILNKTNFSGTIEVVSVNMEVVPDSLLRRHIEVTVTCTFNTPFGEALSLFGMDEKLTYSSTGSADCTDIIEYISTTDFIHYWTSFSGASGVIGDAVKLINSLTKLYNHIYS